jgi:dihydropyrimidinase
MQDSRWKGSEVGAGRAGTGLPRERGRVPAVATLLIRNGRFGDDPALPTGDLLIVDGKIVERGADLVAPEVGEEDPPVEIVDAAGMLLLPGAIDMCSPLAGPRAPSAPADDLGSGTIAAARGGVTTIATTSRAASGENAAGVFADVQSRASGNVFVDWVAAVGIGRPLPETARAVADLREQPGFLGVYLDLDATDEAATAGPGAILRIAAVAGSQIVVRTAGRSGPVAEARRLDTLAGLSALADIRPHVGPISSRAAVEALDPELVGASAGLAHLILDELPDDHRIRPALGTEADRESLWSALADGRLDGVASDHRSPPLSGAYRDWAGIASIELFVPALLTHGVADGRIDLPTLVQIMAERPARALGLWPTKGSFQVGADGDVLIVDPEREWQVDPAGLEGRGKAPAWHGRTMRGAVVHVFSRGQQIVQDGSPLFRPGRGRPVAAESP